MSTVVQHDHRDPTFRNYSSNAAQNYALHRPGYSDELVELILEHHTSTGGAKELLLDVGCGPGTATRLFAPFFENAIGVDPGESMIATARSIPCKSATERPARFEQCGAEDLASVVELGSVDLIIAATSAHWFDLSKFYPAAASVLKHGGSVALFCKGTFYCDPNTTPNAIYVQSLWNKLQFETTAPYAMPGNHHCYELYANLSLPWDISAETEDATAKDALAEFEPISTSHFYFNKDGKPDSRFKNGYLTRQRETLESLANGFNTTSFVARWRDAHKEQLERGEIEDCVTATVRSVKQAMQEMPGFHSRDWLDAVGSTGLIFLKKKRGSLQNDRRPCFHSQTVMA